jgi:hypothetical protein
MNYSTYFTLDTQVVLEADEATMNCAAVPQECPVLSMGYSLDHAVSGEPPLISISAYLIDVTSGASKQIINSTAVNLKNNGWLMNDTAFNLGPNTLLNGANALPAGQYELVLSVTATMFGANPPSALYPASLLMHFDDIGLGFREAAASSFCDDSSAITAGSSCASSLPVTSLFATIGSSLSVQPSQLQSIHFTTQLAITAPGTEVTAYAYLANVQASVSCPRPITASCGGWVEMGQVTFSSSASISVIVPASSASSYIDEYGGLCGDPAGSASVCIRIYAVSTGDFASLHVNSSVVVQTFQQEQSSVIVLNNSTSPIHIVSVYVSGANGVYGDTVGGTPTLDGGSGIWVGGGQQIPIQLGLGSDAVCNVLTGTAPTSLACFTWTTGQTYVVTVTTDKGLVFSGTFVSP